MVKIFGKNFKIIIKHHKKDFIKKLDSKIIIFHSKTSPQLLLKNFLKQLLLAEILKIIDSLKNKGVEIYGNLEIDIKEKIDKDRRLAKIKGNKLLFKLDIITLPKYVIKYIVVHELVHLLVKAHTPKFWKIIKNIYPRYELAQKRLNEIGIPKINYKNVCTIL